MAATYRPRIGLSGAVYSILDETTDVSAGTPTWATVYSLPNVESLKVNFNGSSSTYFGDDAPRFSAETTGVVDVEMNFADLLPDDVSRLFGHTYTGGTIQKAATDVSPYIALGFKSLRSGKDSGTAVYDYVWLYKGKLVKPNADNTTKKDKVEFQTPTVKGQFVALISTGLIGINTRTDDANASASWISGFFSTVALPSANLNALAVTITKGSAGDAGKILCTFAKTGGASFSMSSATVTSDNIGIVDITAKRAGAWVVAGAGTTVIAKFTPTVAFSSESIGIYVTDKVKDTNGIGCTNNGIVLSW